MLKKLLKYDLKFVFQILIVFIILSFFFAIFERTIMVFASGSLMLSVSAKIASGFAISMMVSTLINGFMRNWARFRNNLYKDESYLTHTLPVSKETIYLSKFICGILTMLISVLTILLCLAIMYYSKANLEIIKQSLKLLANTYNSTVLNFLLVIAVVFFLEMLALLLAGYTGIILGHESNNNKLSKSILYASIFYISTQVLTLLAIFILGLFNANIMHLFSSNLVNIKAIQILSIFSIIIYLIYNFVYYLIDLKELKKGVNVD